MSVLLINQGTNAAVNFDLSGTVNTQVIGVGYGTVNTLGTLPNVPGGTIGSIIGIGSVSGLSNIPGGTLNQVNNIGTLPNLPGGTIGSILGIGGTLPVSGNVSISSGTINAATVSSVGGTVATEQQFQYTHLAGNGTTLVKSGNAFLHGFVINSKSVGGNATIVDGTTSSGSVIAIIDTTLSTTAFIYDVKGTVGLTVAIAGATGGDFTIAFR